MKLSEKTRNEIVRLWYGGASMRRIARTLKISRTTVGRALRKHEEERSAGVLHPDLPAPGGGGRSILAPFEKEIAGLLDRYAEITAVRLHEELAAKGFKGGYTLVNAMFSSIDPLDLLCSVSAESPRLGGEVRPSSAPHRVLRREGNASTTLSVADELFPLCCPTTGGDGGHVCSVVACF